MEQRVPKRNEVPAELTWDLSDIYKDTAAWEADAKKAMDLADELASMEGRAAKDAASLLRAMDLYAECMERTYSVYSYAMMKNDEDTRESEGMSLKRSLSWSRRSSPCPGRPLNPALKKSPAFWPTGWPSGIWSA